MVGEGELKGKADSQSSLTLGEKGDGYLARMWVLR